MLRNLLVRTFSACGLDVERTGWERRLKGPRPNEKPDLRGKERGRGRLPKSPCSMSFSTDVTFPFPSPWAVLGGCRVWRGWEGDQRIVG